MSARCQCRVVDVTNETTIKRRTTVNLHLHCTSILYSRWPSSWFSVQWRQQCQPTQNYSSSVLTHQTRGPRTRQSASRVGKAHVLAKTFKPFRTERQSTRMSKITNSGLGRYGPEPFKQQNFGIAGVEGFNSSLSLRHTSALITSIWNQSHECCNNQHSFCTNQTGPDAI